jgi:hypothetical protein
VAPTASPTQAELIDFTAERDRHTRFVGREDVLAWLDERLDGPGEAGWVVLTGGPGMGKSAILSEWLKRREAAGIVVRFASRSEHYRFAEVRSHILQALGAFPGAPVAHRVMLEVVELDNPLIPKLRSLLMTAANDHFLKS